MKQTCGSIHHRVVSTLSSINNSTDTTITEFFHHTTKKIQSSVTFSPSRIITIFSKTYSDNPQNRAITEIIVPRERIHFGWPLISHFSSRWPLRGISYRLPVRRSEQLYLSQCFVALGGARFRLLRAVSEGDKGGVRG